MLPEDVVTSTGCCCGAFSTAAPVTFLQVASPEPTDLSRAQVKALLTPEQGREEAAGQKRVFLQGPRGIACTPGPGGAQ